MKRRFLIIKRIEKNLSQKELAKRVGITNQSVSDYERGKSNPSYEVMRRISEELEAPVDELFFQKWIEVNNTLFVESCKRYRRKGRLSCQKIEKDIERKGNRRS